MLTILAAFLVIYAPVRGEQGSSKNGSAKEPIDVRTLLEKGVTAGSLPEDMVIRLSACLGEGDAKDTGAKAPDLIETWEFTSHGVHRVVMNFKDGQPVYNRIESRPFDSKSICKNLLDGKAIETQARTGSGPETAFAGTIYRRGSRTIEVVWQGKMVLELGETNGAFLQLFKETDARAFGALYEQLANQARKAFKLKAEQDK